MKIEKNKRGELTTTQLVTIIVLIVSFIIILFMIFRLNLGGTTDKEICRNSVVLNDKSPIEGPLDCKTNYLCISGGGDCEGLTASEKIKVDPSSKEEIMKSIADEMSSCWYMFGEDKKLNYAGGYLSTEVYCAVCSIVEFDENVQEKILKITYSEFYDYLEKTKKDSSQSYLKYLYGISNVDDLKFKTKTIVDINNDFISTKDKYSIITGLDSNANDNNFGEGASDNEWINPYIIPTIETPATRCTEFITKA